MEGYGSASLWPQGSAPQGGFGGLTNEFVFEHGAVGGLDASPQLWNQNNQPSMSNHARNLKEVECKIFDRDASELHATSRLRFLCPTASFRLLCWLARGWSVTGWLGNTSAPPFVPMVDANKSSIASSVGNANAKRPNVSLGLGVGGLGSNSPQLAWDGILGPNGVQAQGSESSINALSTMSTLNNPSGSQVRKPGIGMLALLVHHVSGMSHLAFLTACLPKVAQGLPSFDSAKVPAIPNGKRSRVSSV
eukprot:755125-Hanusia_phi.AAC.1